MQGKKETLRGLCRIIALRWSSFYGAESQGLQMNTILLSEGKMF